MKASMRAALGAMFAEHMTVRVAKEGGGPKDALTVAAFLAAVVIGVSVKPEADSRALADFAKAVQAALEAMRAEGQN